MAEDTDPFPKLNINTISYGKPINKERKMK